MNVNKIQIITALGIISAPLTAQPPVPAPQSATIVSAPKSSLRHLRMHLATAPLLLPRGQYVGELQEKWTFPSDHLPVGMSTDDLSFASWNVMNTAYMSWVDGNSQGLSKSALTKENVRIEENGLTIRERHTVDLILEMLSTNPHAAFSLQECSPQFLEELRSKLPAQYQVVYEQSKKAKDQNVVFYDTSVLALRTSQRVRGVFSEEPNRPFQDLLFERLDTGSEVRLLNAHIPGNRPFPHQPTRPILSY